MSLNNRVSIRATMAQRGAIELPAVRGSGPSATSERSGDSKDIVFMNLETDEKTHPLGREVIGEFTDHLW